MHQLDKKLTTNYDDRRHATIKMALVNLTLTRKINVYGAALDFKRDLNKLLAPVAAGLAIAVDHVNWYSKRVRVSGTCAGAANAERVKVLFKGWADAHDDGLKTKRQQRQQRATERMRMRGTPTEILVGEDHVVPCVRPRVVPCVRPRVRAAIFKQVHMDGWSTSSDVPCAISFSGGVCFGRGRLECLTAELVENFLKMRMRWFGVRWFGIEASAGLPRGRCCSIDVSAVVYHVNNVDAFKAMVEDALSILRGEYIPSKDAQWLLDARLLYGGTLDTRPRQFWETREMLPWEGRLPRLPWEARLTPKAGKAAPFSVTKQLDGFPVNPVARA